MFSPFRVSQAIMSRTRSICTKVKSNELCKHRNLTSRNNGRMTSLASISQRNYSRPYRQRCNELTAFEQAVGNTPLLYLKSASETAGCNIYGKAEFMNPGGSVKDRAAYWMIKEAESEGLLVRGEPGIIVEGTAGNTGIGLGLVAPIFGYETIIVIPKTQSQEKKDALRYAGCKLVEVNAVPYKNDNHYVKIAERLANNISKNTNKRILYANQWDNLANQKAHIQGTGPEIWTQTNGGIDAFSCAIGTGGTLTGVGRFLRFVSKNRVKIGLTDPKGACMVRYYNEGELRSEGSSITEGIGQGRITGQLADRDDYSFKPDVALEIDDSFMLETVYRLQQVDGLMCGLSTGTNVAGAIRVAQKLGLNYDNTVVTILCDSAIRYASKQYNISFLQTQGLPMPDWLVDIEKGENSISNNGSGKSKNSQKNTVLGKDGPTNPFGNDNELTQCLIDAIVQN